jgi:Fructosamine kinase
MPNDWESSWAQFFGKHRLQAILNDDRRNNGPDSEIEELGRQCVEQVVPRLLGALEQNGNTIKSVLVHGDLCVPFKQDPNVDGVGMQERMAILENLLYMIHRRSSDTMSMRLEYKR